jgi:putative FmdB family regulatory protein
MPTYDYECEACGHTFEEWQSFHDAELTKCPQCRKKKLRRLLGGGAAIIFKGSGFYETDYRSESYKTAAKADEAPKADAKPETKAETPAETKPAKPAKAKPK